MSTFSGLQGALSSLYAQRRGMDVTGQNIANANTEGYTRQRADLESVGGSAVPAMFAIPDGSSGGVTASGVQRVMDSFLEARGRAEHAQNSYLADQNRIYTTVEHAFGELAGNGLQVQLAKLWANWHEVGNHPEQGSGARSQVIAQAITVTDTLHSTREALGSLFSTTREQLDAYVSDVNTTAVQVAQLNNAVVRGTVAGLPVNELADQRDALIMHLSELTGATALARDSGAMDVLLNGSALVNGENVRQIEVHGGSSFALQTTVPATLVDPVTMTWADNHTPVVASSGQLASSVQALNSVVPTYAGQLDAVASSLVSLVNTQHKAGYDLSGTAGTEFFGPTSGTVTAANISLLITTPDKLAASSTQTSSGAGTLDGANADLIANIGTGVGSPDQAYRMLVANLGVAGQRADQRATMQDSLMKDMDAARTAQSGVSLDEEMTNLIAFQRAYQAASRVISTIDSTLDTLINHTGA
jgi:flagellar hook-associated protein 1 FlgK